MEHGSASILFIRTPEKKMKKKSVEAQAQCQRQKYPYFYSFRVKWLSNSGFVYTYTTCNTIPFLSFIHPFGSFISYVKEVKTSMLL